jgi:toxin ParE1/3/4
VAKNPTIGRPQDEFSPGLRKYPIGKHYIFYRASGKGIEVVRVLHQAMDITRQLSKE